MLKLRYKNYVKSSFWRFFRAAFGAGLSKKVSSLAPPYQNSGYVLAIHWGKCPSAKPPEKKRNKIPIEINAHNKNKF